VRRRLFLASPLLLVATGSVAAADDFPSVVPGFRLEFPRDLGSHPAFRNEWWYITGWVRDADGNDLGLQVTFFRNRPRVAEASRSQFAARQLLFAHAAIADPRHGRLRHEQRAARAVLGLADAAENGTDVRMGDWSLRFAEGSYLARIAAEEFQLDLRFTPVQPVLLQGDQGYSRKGRDANQASYYYSQPQLVVAGSVVSDGRTADVKGTAWLDHEWSSQAMAADANGWDWIGVNLHDGGSLMAFRMRDRAGNAVWGGGGLRTADGVLTRFEPAEVSFTAARRWRSPRTGVEYPVAMRMRAGGIDYALDPLMDDQELDSRTSTGTIYWEGAVRLLQNGREVGRGYLELTGYWKALKL
jgi:predicted secreted hydrolase